MIFLIMYVLVDCTIIFMIGSATLLMLFYFISIVYGI